MPAEARCTSQYDMVLLSAWSSYRAKITRLAAIEKGLVWKHYVIDMGQNQHITPWYLKINPNGYVPSMLVGEQNEVVIESMVILECINSRF